MIIDGVQTILKSIHEDGIEINNTKEVQNVFWSIKRHTLAKHEKKLVANFYDKNIGDWNARLKLEYDHYEFLKAFLIHKIGEVRYFHKGEDLTSRKFVIWSNDCISSIQFLHRPSTDKNTLNVFIRSSDALNLLPADLLFAFDILDAVLHRFGLSKNRLDVINYFITSCHYYIRDEKKVLNIINEVEK
jgi:hypothetical protein